MVLYMVGYYVKTGKRGSERVNRCSHSKDISSFVLYNPITKGLSKVRAEHIKNLILSGNEVRGIYTGSVQDILNCNITPLMFVHGLGENSGSEMDDLSSIDKRVIMKDIDHTIGVLDKYSMPIELYCIAALKGPKPLDSRDKFYTDIVTIDKRLDDVHYLPAYGLIEMLRLENYTQVRGITILDDNVSYNLNGKNVKGANLELDNGIERLGVSLYRAIDREYYKRFVFKGIQLGLLTARERFGISNWNAN